MINSCVTTSHQDSAPCSGHCRGVGYRPSYSCCLARVLSYQDVQCQLRLWRRREFYNRLWVVGGFWGEVLAYRPIQYSGLTVLSQKVSIHKFNIETYACYSAFLANSSYSILAYRPIYIGPVSEDNSSQATAGGRGARINLCYATRPV